MVLRLLWVVLALVTLYACTELLAPPEQDTATGPAPLRPQVQEAGRFARILMLGDSQISYGAGGAYTAFLGNLGQDCPGVPDRLARADVAAIGVRSTALHHWTARSGPAKGVICDVDPTFGVNAGAYGVTSDGRTYVQVGADPAYPLCARGRSPFEAVFDVAHLAPDVIVLSFLGNATDRWQTGDAARADWRAISAQLPPQVACVAMTTIPSFLAPENDRRTRAQANLQAAVQSEGRCAFVPGFTKDTRAAFEGNAAFFRRDNAGMVTDPRHPTAASAAHFVTLQTPALCAALAQAVAK